MREIEPLLSAGLIKGGDLDNAIVIYERQVSQETLDKLADHLHVERKDATRLGYINKRPLTWSNEPARHKLLDINWRYGLNWSSYPRKNHRDATRTYYKQ